MDCGRIIFDGTVDNAIDQYLKEPRKNGGKILDHITQKVSFIEIKEISFNGSENDITTITQNQRYIDISVSGRTDITIFADIAFRISTIDNVPVATFDNGHFRGESEKIEPGDFTIERRIQLPRYLFCGEYKVGITLHQPDITSYFWAPDCVLMYIEGSSSMHGKVLNSKQSGFMGLEIMEP
jgi:lipopolysaccharide transport system ATP-binding protein